MKRLVIISNRVPPVKGRGRAAAGGLAAGLSSALKAFGGLWFGWSGEVKDTQETTVVTHRQDNYTLATLHLSKENHEEYYNGFANRALWPLCHYRPNLVAYDRSFGVGYYRVNVLFAEAVMPLLEPEDTIWVQDYHLIPLGAELQRLGAMQKMGFFLHIPWPASELVVTLPEHRALVRSLFAYDVVGFQTDRDVQSFLDYVIREADGALESDGRVTCFGRTIHVKAFPIGIDAKSIAEMATQPEATEHAVRLVDSLAGRQLIIGVDRLDYSKGIDRRFSAYSKLLQKYPEHRAKVSLLQIAPPSRMEVSAYRAMRRELERLLGRINGEFADYDWVPLRYVNKTYNHMALAGLYRTARVAFVTPLRDGMNLVAKEFVAAQDPENPGVLVLSRFAGAARQLREALIVNPFDEQSMVDALHRGLKMPLEERKSRWQSLMTNVEEHGIDRWRDSFLETLTAA
ncbi:MAG: alpha,alpha-trehalose-phosphate synthase (UDP-forming) [Rhodospirillaceae bacterium]